MMKKVNKRIISVFLLLIMIIAQFSPIFAEDYTKQETTKTLVQYLIENGVDENDDNVLSDAEWAKVKNLDLTNVDLTGIEKAVNLKELSLSKRCNLNSVDFSKLTKLESLRLSNVTLTDENTYYKFPSIPNLKSFSFYDPPNGSYLDLCELGGIEDLSLSNWIGKVKFPIFTDLKYIGVNGEVEIDGKLDLSSCEDVSGYLTVDPSKLVLNSNTFYSRYGRDIRLNIINDEIEVIKGIPWTMCRGEQVYNLIQNDNEGIATFNTVYLSKEKNVMNCEIIGTNVGTTNMLLRDELGHEKTIKVKVYAPNVNEDVDKTLENTGVTPKYVDGCMILMSNGELWEVTSTSTAEVVASNVKDYATCSGGGASILKHDGTLKIEYRSSVKEISNVKQVEDNVYLTNDGKLYGLGLNHITEEINPKLIKENVKNLINGCIVMEDGTTWYQDSWEGSPYADVKYTKLADFEIKDMGFIEFEVREDTIDGDFSSAEVTTRELPVVLDYNNTLWCSAGKTEYFTEKGLEELQRNYDGGALNPHMTWRGVGSSYFYLDESGTAFLGDIFNESKKEILTSVTNLIHWGDFSCILFRCDGSIWSFSLKTGLNKLHSFKNPIILEDDEKFLTQNARIITKNINGVDYVSGVMEYTAVSDFINQDNFNRVYQIMIFDKNETEITDKSLLGTGSTIQIYKNGIKVKEYVVIIYGDTTGDGKISSVDALAVIKHVNGKKEFTADVYIEAGKVHSKSEDDLTAVDALAIIKGVNGILYIIWRKYEKYFKNISNNYINMFVITYACELYCFSR